MTNETRKINAPSVIRSEAIVNNPNIKLGNANTEEMFVRLVFGYSDDTERTYDLYFPQPIDQQAVAAAKAVIVALNSSMGSDTDFKNFFVSDGGAPAVEIKSAELRSIVREVVW